MSFFYIKSSACAAYVAMVVSKDERSAAGGITSLARSLGLVVSPLFLGHLLSYGFQTWQFSCPFVIAGGLKIIYDLTLWGLYSASTVGKAAAETKVFESVSQSQSTTNSNVSVNVTENSKLSVQAVKYN